MGERPTPSITSYFAILEDPRSDHTRRHKLIDIMTIAICGVICGADSWVDLEIFGNSKEGWLKGFLELPNGIPSHDTFGRVFSLLDAQQFQDCFSAWVQAVCAVTRGQVIAIDGKTVRRSHDKTLGKSAIHMVSAWASEPESAIHDFNRELARVLEVGNRLDEGRVLGHLGFAYFLLGEPQRAVEFYQMQLTLAREIGDLLGEGNALWGLSMSLETLNDHPQAIVYAEAALNIFEETNDPRVHEVREALAR